MDDDDDHNDAEVDDGLGLDGADGGGSSAAAAWEEVLALRSQLQARDVEIAHLEARVTAQARMLDQLQESLCESTDAFAQRAQSERDDHDAPPLVIAARRDDVEAIRTLARACPSMVSGCGASALLSACQYGRRAAVEALLELGVDVHTDYDSGLLWACTRGDLALARLLLGRGARASTLNQCALRIAARRGDHEMLQVLGEALQRDATAAGGGATTGSRLPLPLPQPRPRPWVGGGPRRGTGPRS